MLKRVLPPIAETRVVNGRTYIGAPGTPQNVIDTDADMLGANGWAIIAPAGTTAQRPISVIVTPPYGVGPGVQFYDSTLGAIIVHDGLVWRNPVNGSPV